MSSKDQKISVFEFLSTIRTEEEAIEFLCNPEGCVMPPMPKWLQVELQNIYYNPHKFTHPISMDLPKSSPAKFGRNAERRRHVRGHYAMWPFSSR